jgi:outer membrane protein assembly factor BamB
VGSQDNNLYALNPNGTQKWAFDTGGQIASAPVVTVNGTVYICSGNSNVYALSPLGTNLWTFHAGGPFLGSSPALDADGTIYVGGVSTNFYALNPDGSLKWKFGASGPFYASPAIGSDGTIYVGNDGPGQLGLATSYGRLYALAPDGTEKWEFVTGKAVRTTPAVAGDGTIYFGCYDNNFYALNPDGTERWQLNTGWQNESSPAIRFDGAVFFEGGYSDSLYAVLGSASLAASPWPMFQHDLLHTGNAATPRVPDTWLYPFSSNQFDDQVNAVATAGTKIFVGGKFHLAGGVPANYVAEWTGTNWISLGAGVNGAVSAIAVGAAGVYVGGSFTSAGGVSANYIALWDGAQWQTMGGGLGGPVTALALGSNYLYAAGGFSAGFNSPPTNVIKWDGTNWSAVGSGPSGGVFALAVSGNDVYAAVNNGQLLQHWNGTQWVTVGTTSAGEQIYAIAIAGGSIYVGGGFTKINSVAANGVARWNGIGWLPLGSGVSNGPFASSASSLAYDGTNLFVGGNFTSAGGVSANRIASWDGAGWSSLGAGMTGSTYNGASAVDSIGIGNGLLCAGGNFLTAGGDSNVRHFAVWNGTNWSSLGTPIGFADGQFRFLLSDQLGRTYGLEASADLLNWTRVTTFTNLGGYSEFIDNSGSTKSHRFYRVVIP